MPTDFQVTRYERDLDAFGRTVLSETRQVSLGCRRSPHPEPPGRGSHGRRGFVRPSGDGGYDYFGPDASVLLSDQFLDTHCFRLSVDPETGP